jgi:hypothetical protein
MMKPLACLAAVALTAVVPRASVTQTEAAGSPAWGPSSNGLRLGISAARAGPTEQPAFHVTFHNLGDSDYVLNLGYMFANGKVMFPAAVGLSLTDAGGTTRELEFLDRRYAAVAGRVDPFLVALRHGSMYTLALSLSQFWSSATKEYELRLPAGNYRIGARFEGQAVQSANLDVQGLTLMNFWTGRLQSNVLEFDVHQPDVLATHREQSHAGSH